MATDKKIPIPRVKAQGFDGDIPADPAIKAALDRAYRRSRVDIDALARM